MKQHGSMKKSSEQITPNYSIAFLESRGRDSIKGGRFVTTAFSNNIFFQISSALGCILNK
jgi:hypothetical protein